VRVIRSLFAAEQDFLPAPFAAELKVLLEQHIGLRAYYTRPSRRCLRMTMSENR
jgi:hypothetical protein